MILVRKLETLPNNFLYYHFSMLTGPSPPILCGTHIVSNVNGRVKKERIELSVNKTIFMHVAGVKLQINIFY